MIEVFLEQSGWTWYTLSKEMGMSQSTVSKIFKDPNGRGYGNPRVEVLQRLAKATGTSVGFWCDI
jgi:transcriptional regulator with XRE-family HTH domain